MPPLPRTLLPKLTVLPFYGGGCLCLLVSDRGVGARRGASSKAPQYAPSAAGPRGSVQAQGEATLTLGQHHHKPLSIHNGSGVTTAP